MTRVTHEEKVLALLSDGKPHSHHEIYALHVIGHSRISSLRKKGFGISQWRDGDLYLYQLVSRPLKGETAPTEPDSVSPLSGETWAEESRKPTSPLVSRPLEETEVAQVAAVIHSAKGQTAVGERKSAGILGGRVLADTSSVSSSGCVSGVLPDNDRVDTNVQSPAPLDPQGSRVQFPPMLLSHGKPVTEDRKAPDREPESLPIAVLPGGQLTLRWAA